MILTLLACAGPDLSFAPTELTFGDVDFAGEMPEGGYATESVDLTRVSGPTVELWLPEYDTDRLCLAGFDADRDYPLDLGALDEGSTYTFVVGICAYVASEIDTAVTTELVVETDGDPESVSLPITFTPIRSAE